MRMLVETGITKGIYHTQISPKNIFQFNFPSEAIICWSAIYIVEYQNVNKERKFLPNYIIFQDLDKSLISTSPLFSNVLYGWCPKCRQTHKTMYSRVEGYV